uniref:Cell division cycle protein 123 homolog n=1 Tax=Kalanchoe fedtschenkoi TaxID=63787 RepID=A0A7N0U7U9_KALFE
MRVEEVNRCQIKNWYPKFKAVSFETIIHELPEPFVDYLNDSGPFILPASSVDQDALPNRVHNPYDEDDFQVAEGSEDEAEYVAPPSFPELEQAIKKSIDALGGAVIPKLNWSVPKDTAWISSTGTLKCTSFSEIALLLKSSDSLGHDLSHAYDSCTDKTSTRPSTFFLALRKWYRPLRPEMEFRCFVRCHNLVGISQREVTGFYPALIEKKDDIRASIHRFFLENIKSKFESEAYAFDVYVKSNGHVKLLDFNPWGGSTIPLLFDWEELENTTSDEENMMVDFRIIESQCTVRPGLKTAVPFDYLDTSEGSGWDDFLRKADVQLQQQTKFPEAGA